MPINFCQAIESIEDIFSRVTDRKAELRVFMRPDADQYLVTFVKKEEYLTPVERAIEAAWEKN